MRHKLKGREKKKLEANKLRAILRITRHKFVEVCTHISQYVQE